MYTVFARSWSAAYGSLPTQAATRWLHDLFYTRHITMRRWPYCLWPVWPDRAIYCTLGNFSMSMVTIILPIFRQFVEVVKIFHFSSEISFGPLFMDIWLLFTGQTACDRQLRVVFLFLSDFSFLLQIFLYYVDCSHQ